MEAALRQHGEQSTQARAKAKREVTAKALFELIKAQKHRCALSGLQLSVDNVALDHIQPKCAGGGHYMGNVQWVDPRVNSMKGTMPQEEFVRLCCAVAAWSGGDVE